jgi:hypothetical protein
MVITVVAVEDPSTRIVGFEVDIDRRQRWQQDGVFAARQPIGAHHARPPRPGGAYLLIPSTRFPDEGQDH